MDSPSNSNSPRGNYHSIMIFSKKKKNANVLLKRGGKERRSGREAENRIA